MKKRLLCPFLILVLLITLLVPAIPDAQAAKQEKTRAIGIVFDNSGSMYEYMYGRDNKKAWCQATYAMEAFASMMNSGDVLQIYPMNPITLGAKEYTMDAPLVIQGPEQSETIRQIYTPNAGDTPFKTVTAAYNGLLRTTADEKYLIVLTDGRFEENGVFEEMDNVNTTLDQYTKDMNIMFLGLGIDDIYIPTESNPTRQHYVKANNSSLVLTELTAMCNRIFGRDLLPLSGNTAAFDVSMSKLIVFIQGENISDVTLGGKSPVAEHGTKYSELGCGNEGYNWLVDASLQGVIATFEDLDAGSYDLSYSGNATSTSIYYEPDVDLAIQLTDSTGNPVGNEIYADTYTLNYALVDKNGNPTASDLLGDTAYNIQYEINGETFAHQDSKPGSVELTLNPGDTLDGRFSARYLKDYAIEKTSSQLGWPAGGLQVITRPVGQVTAKVEGGKDLYPLSQLEEQAVYEVSVFCEGEQITGADLDRAEVTVELENGNAVPLVQKTGNGFTVTLKYNGAAADTKCGIQNAIFHTSYTNIDGQTGQADSVTRKFEIQDDSSSLKVHIQLEQSYYVISKLDEAAPIRFRLTAGGQPLSPEQFAATEVKVDIESLAFDLQADPQNSAYTAKLQPGQKIASGKYTVSCVANGFDEIGRPVTAEDSAKIECRPYPIWIPWLILLACLLVLGFLIWMILNAKILPKKIIVNAGAIFNVDGELIPGNVICNFAGGNKKRGSLKIQSPPYMANPLAKCGFTLELEAVSPRITKSRSRFARCRAIKPLNPATTVSMMVGGFQMAKDPVSEKLVRVGGNPDAPIDFRIGHNNRFVVAAEIQSMDDGSSITCSLTGNLTFL